MVPTFSHQLDVTPAIVWSISADKFSSYVSNYENRGVQIIGFREYWEKAQNSHHTAISNVLSDPGVSLGFTVANIGGKSRLLVNAPWATTVRDGSGGEVPFEVAGSGIVVEVEAGNYTVSAGLHADFSADKTAAVIGQAIQFTNLSAGGAIPLSYEWDFGDSTGSTLQNPSHSYGSAGTYTVALQVTDSAEETDTETKASYITVTAAPPPNHPPDTPVNSSPANGAGGVSLTPLLQSAAFSDADGGDTHMASRWQVRVISGSYANPAYDSGTVATHLTGITLPPGALSHSTTYYWRVRHQDNHAAWSDWSSETSFTAIDPPNQVPGQPSNVSPPDGAAAVSLLPTLQSSAFSDPDVGDIHAASQWQVRATGGEYSDPVYDSGTVATDLTSLSVPVGELGYSTIYYWRVRHQDDDSAWSEWSSETSFATVDPPNQLPGQPSNVSPANGASAVDVAPTLQSSAFSDPDVEDIHAASQWQVTAISGDYSSPAYDSGTAAGDLTSVSVPAGGLDYSITYYWRVRHQDDDSAWSDWSSETWFATVDPPNHPPGQPGNVTPASGVTGVSLIPALTSSAFSDPDAGDAHAASQWQIRTVTGSYSSPVFDSATDTANLAAVNIPSGALTYSTAYYWRARHQDNHGAWSDWSAETSFATVGPPVDSTPPSIPAVSDDGLSTTVATSLHANWASTDPESGVVEFEYAVGTSPGGTDVVGWTSAGGASGANQTGLSLTVGTTYYFSVRARNGAGLWSAKGGSDGITVVDEEDTTPAPSDVEDEGIALWILLPVMFGLIAAPGFAIYFLRRRPGAG